MNNLDTQDTELLSARVAARAKLTGPRVGDFVIMRDGEVRRFTHDWGDGLQTTLPKFGAGSFYMHPAGGCDYSGALDSSISKELIAPTLETKPGRVWFFHHDWHAAHNGVDVTIDFKVWKVVD